VNVPLALVFAWVVSFFYRPAFQWCVILGYWLTNVLGFVLMQKGGERMFPRKENPTPAGRCCATWGFRCFYTGLIVWLLKLEILKPIENYFQGKS